MDGWKYVSIMGDDNKFRARMEEEYGRDAAVFRYFSFKNNNLTKEVSRFERWIIEE